MSDPISVRITMDEDHFRFDFHPRHTGKVAKWVTSIYDALIMGDRDIEVEDGRVVVRQLANARGIPVRVTAEQARQLEQWNQQQIKEHGYPEAREHTIEVFDLNGDGQQLFILSAAGPMRNTSNVRWALMRARAFGLEYVERNGAAVWEVERTIHVSETT